MTHADLTLERRYPSTPHETFTAFSDPGLRRRWFANPGDWPDFDAPDGALVRQSGTGTFLDALGRLLASEPVR